MALWGSPSGGGRPPGYIELPTLAPSHQHDDDDTCIKCNRMTVNQNLIESNDRVYSPIIPCLQDFHVLTATFPTTFTFSVQLSQSGQHLAGREGQET